MTTHIHSTIPTFTLHQQLTINQLTNTLGQTNLYLLLASHLRPFTHSRQTKSAQDGMLVQLALHDTPDRKKSMPHQLMHHVIPHRPARRTDI